MSIRVLIAFDFDHTIINDNSDTYIRRLAPNNGAIPTEISKLYSDKGWTRYMAEVFKYLHVNGITPSQLLNCVAEIPMVSGMAELLSYINVEQQIEGTEVNVNFDAIIISDANSVGTTKRCLVFVHTLKLLTIEVKRLLDVQLSFVSFFLIYDNHIYCTLGWTYCCPVIMKLF